MKGIIGCEKMTKHISDISVEVVDEVVVETNYLFLGEMAESDNSLTFHTYSEVTAKPISITGFESVTAADVDALRKKKYTTSI